MKPVPVPGIMLLDNKWFTHRQAIQDALAYFDVLSPTQPAGDILPFNGYNTIGIVDLACLTNDAARLTTDDDLELTAVLESLSNILIAAVMKKTGNDPKKQVDPVEWEKGYNALISLFCSSYSKNVIEYEDSVFGYDAIIDLMKAAFDVNGEPTGKLRDDILNYLNRQGTFMRAMDYDKKETSPCTLFGFSNFIKSGVRRCCFTAYFSAFTLETAKISKSCKSDKKRFDFNFTVTHCNANFMIANWETNPDFRQRVKDFIKNHPPGGDYFDDWATGGKFNNVPAG